MITGNKKQSYRVRYVKVIEDLTKISEMKPNERYMYSLMNTVIFQDFETALDVVIEDFKNSSNDNKPGE